MDFKKELMKNPFQKIFSKNLSKLIEINLNNESDISMV